MIKLVKVEKNKCHLEMDGGRTNRFSIIGNEIPNLDCPQNIGLMFLKIYHNTIQFHCVYYSIKTHFFCFVLNVYFRALVYYFMCQVMP